MHTPITRKPVLKIDDYSNTIDMATLDYTLAEWWGTTHRIGIVVWEHDEIEADGLPSQTSLFTRNIKVRALPDPDRMPEAQCPELWHAARCERAVQIGRVRLAIEQAQALVA